MELYYWKILNLINKFGRRDNEEIKAINPMLNYCKQYNFMKIAMTQMKEKTCKLLVNTKKLLSNPYKQAVYFASTIEWE